MTQPDDLLRQLWTPTPDEEKPMPAIDLDAIRARADKFDRQLRHRDLREALAGLVVLGLFGWMGLDALREGDALGAAGPALVVLGTVVMLVYLWRRGRAPMADPATDARAFLAGYRAELEWQVKLLRDVPRWYIGPLVPGMLAMVASVGLEVGHEPDQLIVFGLLGIGVPAAIFAGVIWLNRVGARKLEERLAALPELTVEE